MLQLHDLVSSLQGNGNGFHRDERPGDLQVETDCGLVVDDDRRFVHVEAIDDDDEPGLALPTTVLHYLV